MSSNTFLIDAASRHAVLLQRYSAGLESDMADKVKSALAGVISDLSTMSGNQGSMRLEIVSNYRTSLTTAEAQLYDELLDLMSEEAEFSEALFEEAINASLDSPSQLQIAFDATEINVIPGQRVTIPSMLSQFTTVKANQINRLLQDGFTEGLTQDQLISRVREIEPLQRRQAASLVRTGTNAVSSIARYQTAMQNSDVLEGYEWVSTLDDKTSLVCASRDGVVYPFSNSSPKPPAHFSACIEGCLIKTKRGEIPIQHVKVGDMVMTHAGRWKPVTCVMAKPHKGKIKKLVDRFGHGIALTNEHPILTDMGYADFGSVNAGAKVFKYVDQFPRLKHWVLGTLVEQRVLVDSHNIKTQTTERLVSYSVSSFSTGVSSSVNLNNSSVDDEVSNIYAHAFLKFVRHLIGVKKLLNQGFVKCWFRLKGLRE